MDKIKVGEYVRTKDGIIDKIFKFDEILNEYWCENWCEKGLVIDLENKIGTHLKDIVNHSFNIKDLIENKDILKVKTKENEILMIGFDENTTDVKYKEIIEEIENGEYELLEILTHEQYERNCYVVKEDKDE